MIKQYLKNWRGALNTQIGDVDKELKKYAQSTAALVEMRDDLDSLIKYLEVTTMPDPVKRAIERCLEWNPFTKP